MEESVQKYDTIVKKLFAKDLNGTGFRLVKQETVFKEVEKYFNETHITIEDRLKLIQLLIDNFNQVPWNICIAVKEIDLIRILINEYLKSNHEEYQSLIKNCLSIILSSVDNKREDIEIIYQSLAENIRNHTINSNILFNHLQCLYVLYGKDTKPVKPKNYFYFNGGQGHVVSPCISNISIKDGCAFSIWFYISLNKAMKEELNCDKYSTLIEIKCENNQNLLIILDKMDILVKSGEKAVKLRFLSPDQWINFSFIIEPNKNKQPTLSYSLNSSTIHTIKLEQFNCSNSIVSIAFFKNFIGKATSMIFYDGKIQFEALSRLSQYYPFGFYTNKQISKLAEISAYNSKSANYEDNMKKDISIIYSHIKLFYVPSQCKNELIEDICSNINGQIYYNTFHLNKNNDDNNHTEFVGVCNKVTFHKHIAFLGGINALLPIAEEITTMKFSKTNELLELYFDIIYAILNNKKSNILDAWQSNFFPSLSLFITKLHSNMFNRNFAKKLIQLGKTLMLATENKETAEIYVCSILFNINIFEKLSIENQIALWDFLSNYSKFARDIFLNNKEFMPLGKICHLLRYYDKNHSYTYCCSYHAKMYKDNKEVENPELMTKIGKLMSLIDLTLEQNNNRSYYLTTLMNMLILDISPCLQKAITNLITKYLCNESISFEIRLNSMNKLIHSKFNNIIMYLISFAIFDVRIELISLLTVFMNLYSEKISIDPKYKRKIKHMIYFVKENVFPNYVYLSLERSIDEIMNQNDMQHDIIQEIVQEKNVDEEILYEYENIETAPVKPNTQIKAFKKESSFTKAFTKRKVTHQTLNSFAIKDKLLHFEEDETNENNKKKSSDSLRKNYLRREGKSKTITVRKNIMNLDEPKLTSSFHELGKKKKKKKINTFINQCVDIIKHPFSFSNKQSGTHSINNTTNTHPNNNFDGSNSQLKENEKEELGLFSDFSYHLSDEINIKDDYFQSKIRESDQLQEDKSSKEDTYTIIKENYTNSTKGIVEFINESSLFTLTHQMLNSLYKWLIMEQTSQITNEYVINIIIKFLLYTDISHISMFIRNLNDCLLANDGNSLKLLSLFNFYNWLIEIMFQCYLIVYPNHGTEYTSVLYFFSEEQKEHMAKDLFENCLIFHSKLIMKGCENGIMKLKDILLVCTKYKQKYNNDIKFRPIVNSFIRLVLIDLLEFCSSINQGIEPELSKQKEFFQMVYQVVLISFEFILFYNIENKPKFSNELLINRSIFPEFLFSSLSMFNDTLNKMNKFSLKEIWDDYNLSKSILKIFKSFWVGTDLHGALEILRTEKVIKPTFINQMQILLINNGYISILRIITGVYVTTILISQDIEKTRLYLEEYTNFLLFCIISTSFISNEEYFQSVKEELTQVIAYGLYILYEEYSRKFNKENEIYGNSIEVLLTATIKILYSTKFSSESQSKPQFFSIKPKSKDKKKHNSYKSVITIFTDHLIDLSQMTNTPIFNEQTLENLYLNQYNEKNKEFFLSPLVKNSITDNMNLRNYIGDFFYTKFFENNCEKRLFDMKRYHLSFDKQNKAKQFYSYNYYHEKQHLVDMVKNKSKFYLEEIQRWTIEKVNSMKKNIKSYYYIKKQLYTWRGIWSNRKVYYDNPSLLKYKTVNHYGSNLIRPIIVPIVDINYYLPEFTHFNKKTMFLCNDYDTSVNMDIYSSLTEVPLLDIPLINNNENDNDKKEVKMQTVITIAHQFTYPELIDIYAELNNISYDSIKIPESFELNSNNMFNCCYVKQSFHTKGTITMTDNLMEYTNNQWEISKSEDLDEERKVCYGSIFSSKNRNIYIKISYKEIKYLFNRTYFYKKTAIEIFTTNNKSYFFNFPSALIRARVMIEILKMIEFKREIKIDIKEKCDEIIGYEVFESKQVSKVEANVSLKLDQWSNWKISTFDFLLWLNICANRSFSDMLQYPVFPWILCQYNQETLLIEDNSTDLRDLKLPMGMLEYNQTSSKRKKEFFDGYKEKINLKKEDEQSQNVIDTTEVNFYGSHYSNPIYVSHFLTRLFPYSSIMIELQGYSFDDPDRIFTSLERTFECASSEKMDVRELCPEFYYLPEIFLNINDLDFKISKDKGLPLSEQKLVGNIVLPPWCDNNPYNFILKMKETIERFPVSSKINKWIDLIFGYKQKGKEAEISGNIFPKSSYDDFNIETIEKDQRSLYYHLADFGLIPHQLFSKEVPNRKKLEFLANFSFNKQITHTKQLCFYFDKSKNTEKLLMLKLKVLENDQVMCIYKNNLQAQFKITFIPQESKYQIDTIYKKKISQSNLLCSKINDYYNECNFNCPLIIYRNGTTIAQAGYWDGHISVNCFDNNLTKEYRIENTSDLSPVIVLSMDFNEKIVIAGSINGSITMYKVNKWNYWEKYNMLYHHTQEITAIFICNNLNIFASCSKDGFVMLYTLPLGKLIRSVKLKENLFADHVFISASPLPSFSIYSNKTKHFYCYSINGYFLSETQEDNGLILSPVIFSDYSFKDYMIYGTSDGYFKLRAFPNMKLITELNISQQSIKCVDITEDRTYCYAWANDRQTIIVIKDPIPIDKTTYCIHQDYS